MDTQEAVAAFLRERQPADTARASMSVAIGVNPDQEAEFRRLAAASGLPVDSVRSAPAEVKQQTQLRSMDFGEMSKQFPETTKFLGNVDNARIAHDDTDNMGAIEAGINGLKRGVPGLKQIGSAWGFKANSRLLESIDEVEKQLAAGVHPNLINAQRDVLNARFMTQEYRDKMKASLRGSVVGNVASIVSNQGEKDKIPQPAVVDEVMKAKGFGAAIDAFKKDPVTFVASVGAESLVTSGPGMVAAIPAAVAGGPAAGAAVMGAGSFASDYGSSIMEALGREGVDIRNPQALIAASQDPKIMNRVASQAFAHALVVGTFDAASGGVASKLAIPQKLATKMVASPLARETANAVAQIPIQGALGAAGEAGGELAAGQPLDPGNILAEFVGESFGAPAEIASVAAGRVKARVAEARKATADAQAIETLSKLADASKVKARDSETFKEFVNQVAEGGDAPTELYIDPHTLVNSLSQSGMTLQELRAVAPTVEAQLSDALASGVDVRIPVAEFAATGDEFTAPLIDHLRTAPDAMTRAEATKYLSEKGAEIEQQVRQAMDRHEEKTAFQESTAQVKAQFEQELGKTKRFTADVNSAYASLLANFYAAQAARVGMQPHELAQKYGLRVSSTEAAGANTLNQDSPAFKAWFGDSKVVDASGKPLVLYHGTASDITEFDGRSKYEGGIYFTADPRYAGGRARVAEGMGHGEAANVMPAFVRIKNPAPATMSVAEAKARGHDGIIRDNEVVAFEPTQIKSAVGNRGTFDPNDANILHQPSRANISFADDITKSASVIALLKGADLSSFIHETGHFFLEVQADLATRIQAQIDEGASVTEGERQIVADMGRLLDWFGIKGENGALAQWNGMTLEEKREFHEQFARGFEAYAMEGKSPSIELQGIFQRFRSWLLNVYKSLRELNVTLTDDVRAVMGRMLASETAIEEAEAQRNMGSLFKDAETAGMTLDEYKAYQEMAAAATVKAVDELQVRGMKDMKWLSRARDKALKAKQAEVEDLRREVRHEVTSEVMSQQVYRAWQFLSGKADAVDTVTPGAQPVGEIDTITQKGKLRTSALKELAPEQWEVLSKRRMTSEENGIHPEIVAELFGYDSADAMVHALVEAQPPKEVIADLTDQRMLERYGDIGSEEALNRAADEAVHNEARARFIASELKALEEAGTVREKRGKRSIDVMAQAARQYAADIIARLKVRDIRPAQYAASEARAARAAEKAFKAGDTAEAAAHKRNQLINNYATKAAYAAQDEVRSAIKYFRRFNKPSKTIDISYREQIEALLERFDLSNASLKEIDRRKTLAEWVESQREQGLEPSIPPELLNEANRQSWKDMTVEQIRGLRDTVEQIEHLGRLKNRLLTNKDKRDFEAVRAEIVTSIEAHAGNRQADTRTSNTRLGEKIQSLRKFWASHIKAASWARVMDGGKDGGPMWEHLIRGANDAGNAETVAREKSTKELTALVAPVLKQGKLGGKGEFFPNLPNKGGKPGRSLNREAKLAIALNTGNESNLQRLLGGEGWTIDNIKPVLDTLTAEDWKFVQGVWDYFESFRPQIAAKERRVYGREPDWIEPTPVVTKFGTLRGGYYPVKYDPRASERAEAHSEAEDAKRMMQGAYTAATTRRSFTKARVEEVQGRPLLYSLDGIYNGVQEVIHDLSWHEWLIDANKILKNQTIAEVIRERYGPEVHQQFKSWVQDIAGADAGARAAGETALAWIRQGTSIAGLGLNVMSAIKQPIGITQSIVRIGPKWVGRGIVQFMGSPVQSYREVNAKSDFMRTRALTRMRELAELRSQVKGQTKLRSNLDAAAYALMLRAQQLVDIPTWLGAYEKAIADGNDEARAAALSDQAVIDAQGSGSTKDLSAIERGGPALKLFTVFYSFMNTALNVGYVTTQTEASKAKIAANYLLLYVIPPILGFALVDALTPGDSGDFDDWEKFANRAMKEEIGSFLGLFFGLRELAGLYDAFKSKPGGDYQGPAGTRLLGDTTKLAKQVGQGDMDDGLRKAIINEAGDLFRLPSAQINRSITGTEALIEGKTSNPAAVVFGYQEAR